MAENQIGGVLKLTAHFARSDGLCKDSKRRWRKNPRAVC